MMTVYNILLCWALTMGLPLLFPIILLSPKRRKTVLHRLGLTPIPGRSRVTEPGKCRRVWIHALSVGEVISAVPLIKAWTEHFPRTEIVFSASTQTGIETAHRLIREHVCAVFHFPHDLIFSVKHIVSRIDPDLAVIVETDIWPNFLMEMRRRQIPVFLVNTRLSAKSFAAYRKVSFFTKPLFQCFEKICPQSRADAQRFRQVGVSPDRIVLTGNMKFDQPVTAPDERSLRQMRENLGIDPGRKILIAGSTHEGEEHIVSIVYAALKHHVPELALIIAPRNPDRAGIVCRIFRERGYGARKMAEVEENPSPVWDVMAVDRIGVLKNLYGLSDIAFVGGSLVPLGGHNPLEPAALARPVLFGPHMSDFAEISQMLMEAEAAVQVRDQESFCKAALDFLRNENRAREAGKQGHRVFCENRGAVERTVAAIRNSVSLGKDGRKIKLPEETERMQILQEKEISLSLGTREKT